MKQMFAEFLEQNFLFELRPVAMRDKVFKTI